MIPIQLRWLIFLIGLGILAPQPGHARKTTVCTITVNSPDEKEVFQRRLPRDRFEFVELVEAGRPDWLAKSCAEGIRCDMLIISGHFASGSFFSDRLQSKDQLPFDEMERVSCSESCPGLFGNLKEAFLFGCGTLSSAAVQSAGADARRSLERSGLSRAETDRFLRALNRQYSESNQDRMRRIFYEVPALYGFGNKAPLGPEAASVLARYFQAPGATQEMIRVQERLVRGAGHRLANHRLASYFGEDQMRIVGGLTPAEPKARVRAEMCKFFDDRLTPARKLDFVGQLLQREMAEVRMYLERIETYLEGLPGATTVSPEWRASLGRIASDGVARERFLQFARDADPPPARVRMMDLASRLGWLTPAHLRQEQVRIVQTMIEAPRLGSGEADIVCDLAKQRNIKLGELRIPERSAPGLGVARACLGDADARQGIRAMLLSRDEELFLSAQIFFEAHPMTTSELGWYATEIGRGTGGVAAAERALHVIARQNIRDRALLNAYMQLLTMDLARETKHAVAPVFLFADWSRVDRPKLIEAVRKTGLAEDGALGFLLRRLENR
ncbi:MAG TPA: hypothetical protein VLB72_02695 [Burkholderiales bacterium]|nr:hypothetical protein [Burkholderiales bacterium]